MSAVSVALATSVAAALPGSNQSLSPARRHSAANQPHAGAAVDRRDRQTDGHWTIT